MIEVTRNHNTGQGHHNLNDPQCNTSTDCKLPIRKEELFPSDVVKNWDVAEIMGKTRNMVEGFINDMVSELSYLEAPVIAKDSNKTTNENEMRKLKSAVVDEDNNDGVKCTNTWLKPNIILGAHILEEKEEWFYQLADNYDVWNNPYTPTKGNEMGAHTHLPVTLVSSTLPNTNITENKDKSCEWSIYIK